MALSKDPANPEGTPVPAEETFNAVEEFERSNPQYGEVARTFELTMEQYQASLSALYRPIIYSSDSAGAGAYGDLE